MIRIQWKNHLHMFFGGNLLGREYHAEEGYVTQWLEMGQLQATEGFDRNLNDFMLRF
ncbi:hypothetical protein NDK47_25825 [Brevibacillus ruminantium]|uniref:Uncharacterized protein n=1 Tax=Brevibacillus ruminantium TaxID=2950604 RepID=A0ABY4WF16_9BACL|nr:hypothetical protein [Brevibacillus ruminantium]USG65484.1 hypothetical protein NDK47_25825 [Brevibacillus ruminantium]